MRWGLSVRLLDPPACTSFDNISVLLPVYGVSISNGLVVIGVYSGSSYLIYDYTVASCTEIAGDTLSAPGLSSDGSALISSAGLVAAIFDDSNNYLYIAFFQCSTTTCTAFGDPVLVTTMYAASSPVMNRNLVVVGAPDASSNGQGQVTVFECNSTSCTPSSPFSATDSLAGDNFGWAVSWSGTVLVVGAPNANNSGAVYLFDCSTLPCGQQGAGFGLGDGSFQNFGNSLASSGSNFVVGASNSSSGQNTGFLYEVTNTSITTTTVAAIPTATTTSTPSSGCLDSVYDHATYLPTGLGKTATGTC